MDSHDFLKSLYVNPDAQSASTPCTVLVSSPGADTIRLDGLQLDMIEEACPLLAAAFEQSHGGSMVYSLDGFPLPAVLTFLRWVHTLDLLPPHVWLDDVSLLTLLQVYELARNHDSSLAVAAVVTTFQESISRSSLSGQLPRDLIRAMSYLHDELDSAQPFYAQLVDYCAAAMIKNYLITDRACLGMLRDRPRLHRHVAETCAARPELTKAAEILVRLRFNSYDLKAIRAKHQETTEHKETGRDYESQGLNDAQATLPLRTKPIAGRGYRSSQTLEGNLAAVDAELAAYAAVNQLDAEARKSILELTDLMDDEVNQATIYDDMLRYGDGEEPTAALLDYIDEMAQFPVSSTQGTLGTREPPAAANPQHWSLEYQQSLHPKTIRPVWTDTTSETWSWNFPTEDDVADMTAFATQEIGDGATAQQPPRSPSAASSSAESWDLLDTKQPSRDEFREDDCSTPRPLSPCWLASDDENDYFMVDDDEELDEF